MIIALIAYLHGFGGAEKQIIMLANEMAKRGNEVTLISLCQSNLCYEVEEKVKKIYIKDKGKGIKIQINRYYDLRKTLKKIKPDVTINFWFQSAYFTAFMSPKITGKVIYSERGDPFDKEYIGLLGFIRKISLPLIDGFVFQSKGAQKFFSKKIQKKSIIIHNPVLINAENFNFLPKRNKIIVNVGRLCKQKNQMLLIEAFSYIANDLKNYNLEIYGDGDEKQNLEKIITTLNLQERVKLKGSTKTLHEDICNSSLFVLSSDYEGLPNVLIEAMALGLPCISTDCSPGGVREIINNDIDGIIVPCNDSKKLSEAIKKLILNQEQAKRLASNAKKNIKRFSKEKIYNEWENYLQSICKKTL